MTTSQAVNTFTEEFRCGLCNGSEHEVRWKFSDRRILRCLACGAIFSDLIWYPEKVQQLYETSDFFAGDYWRWDGQSALDQLDSPAYKWALLAAKGISGGAGRLLDVGCGLGGFLAQAVAFGFTSEGTDISEYTRTVVQQRLGLTVHLGDLSSISLPSKHYDVVSCWDTLEHVLDPAGLLKEMRRIVKPGGILILRTINEHTILTAMAGALYRAGIRGAAARMHEAYHLYYFTRPSLSQLLSETSFVPLLRFDCEIDVERLGLPTAAQFAMRLVYMTQSFFNREFMQLVIARAN